MIALLAARSAQPPLSAGRASHSPRHLHRRHRRHRRHHRPHPRTPTPPHARRPAARQQLPRQAPPPATPSPPPAAQLPCPRPRLARRPPGAARGSFHCVIREATTGRTAVRGWCAAGHRQSALARSLSSDQSTCQIEKERRRTTGITRRFVVAELHRSQSSGSVGSPNTSSSRRRSRGVPSTSSCARLHNAPHFICPAEAQQLTACGP